MKSKCDLKGKECYVETLSRKVAEKCRKKDRRKVEGFRNDECSCKLEMNGKANEKCSARRQLLKI